MSWSLIQSSLNLTTATAGGLFLSSMDSVRGCHETMVPLSFSAKGQQTASEFFDQGRDFTQAISMILPCQQFYLASST
jgi:hypothetical protein